VVLVGATGLDLIGQISNHRYGLTFSAAVRNILNKVNGIRGRQSGVRVLSGRRRTSRVAGNFLQGDFGTGASICKRSQLLVRFGGERNLRGSEFLTEEEAEKACWTRGPRRGRGAGGRESGPDFTRGHPDKRQNGLRRHKGKLSKSESGITLV